MIYCSDRFNGKKWANKRALNFDVFGRKQITSYRQVRVAFGRHSIAGLLFAHMDAVERVVMTTADHDLALLKTRRDVRFNVNVQPVCLPTRRARVGTDCVAVGWGATQGERRPLVDSLELRRGCLI